MGKEFGRLGATVRGTITYTMSPMEQKAMAGILTKGIPNSFRRFFGQVFRVAPPLVMAYLVYDWAEKEHARLTRKDPKLYENDQ